MLVIICLYSMHLLKKTEVFNQFEVLIRLTVDHEGCELILVSAVLIRMIAFQLRN